MQSAEKEKDLFQREHEHLYLLDGWKRQFHVAEFATSERKANVEAYLERNIEVDEMRRLTKERVEFAEKANNLNKGVSGAIKKLEKLIDKRTAETRDLRQRAEGLIAGVFPAVKEQLQRIEFKVDGTIQRQDKLINDLVDKVAEGGKAAGSAAFDESLKNLLAENKVEAKAEMKLVEMTSKMETEKSKKEEALKGYQAVVKQMEAKKSAWELKKRILRDEIKELKDAAADAASKDANLELATTKADLANTKDRLAAANGRVFDSEGKALSANQNYISEMQRSHTLASDLGTANLQLQELRTAARDHFQEIRSVEEKCAKAEKERDEQQKLVGPLRQQKQDAEALVRSRGIEMVTLRDEKLAAETSVIAKEKIISARDESIRDLDGKMRKLEIDLGIQKGVVNTRDATIVSLEAKKDHLVKEVARYKNNFESAEAKVSDRDVTIINLKGQIKSLGEDKSTAESTLREERAAWLVKEKELDEKAKEGERLAEEKMEDAKKAWAKVDELQKELDALKLAATNGRLPPVATPSRSPAILPPPRSMRGTPQSVSSSTFTTPIRAVGSHSMSSRTAPGELNSQPAPTCSFLLSGDLASGTRNGNAAASLQLKYAESVADWASKQTGWAKFTANTKKRCAVLRTSRIGTAKEPLESENPTSACRYCTENGHLCVLISDSGPVVMPLAAEKRIGVVASSEKYYIK